MMKRLYEFSEKIEECEYSEDSKSVYELALEYKDIIEKINVELQRSIDQIDSEINFQQFFRGMMENFQGR